eukprot:1156473-Pelagomonas_calceolata.AAC.2
MLERLCSNTAPAWALKQGVRRFALCKCGRPRLLNNASRLYRAFCKAGLERALKGAQSLPLEKKDKASQKITCTQERSLQPTHSAKASRQTLTVHTLSPSLTPNPHSPHPQPKPHTKTSQSTPSA